MKSMSYLKCKKCNARIKVNSAKTRKYAEVVYGDVTRQSLLEAAFDGMKDHCEIYHKK